MKSVALPKGFSANGIHCGLKKKRKDLALFYSERPARCAAVFTKNKVKAAPVVLAQEQLRNNTLMRAVLVNSGNANCMTGERGLKDAATMVKSVSQALDVPSKAVLVSSTGIIGVPMNLEPFKKGLPELVRGLSPSGLLEAADGIMTTDRFRKISERTFTVGGETVRMVGVAKGAGMIKPNMATMLCFILTDAAVTEKAAKKAVLAAADDSFNSITVDGDMSTNDTLMLLANGAASNLTVTDKGKDFAVFLKNLKAVCLELAKMIVVDGEGATKIMKVHVKGARSRNDAKKAARSIANSLLFKCAVHGSNPNWGRIASTVGSCGIDFDPDVMDVVLDGVFFLKNGKPTTLSKEKVRAVFTGKEVAVDVKLNLGRGEAVAYGCDVSKRYIAINSYYRT